MTEQASSPPPARLRLFYALWPDPATRAALARAQDALTGRKSRPENLHITLAFLGLQDARLVEPLEKILWSLPETPFLLSLDMLGYFHRAQIAWAGMTEPPAGMLALHTHLREALVAADIPGLKVEPFRPHVTLARNAERPPTTLLAPPIAWRARHVVLVESRGGNGNPTVYRILAERTMQVEEDAPHGPRT